ncbi:MAG: hypothetical protein MZV65_46240 [Chromatiales bacterium]|nr:hypothetical protein [Chromatiales bacterium]
MAAKAQSVVAAEYRGLTWREITDLRAEAREAGRLSARRQEHPGAARRQGTRRSSACTDSLVGPLAFGVLQRRSGARRRRLLKRIREGPTTSSIVKAGDARAGVSSQRASSRWPACRAATSCSRMLHGTHAGAGRPSSSRTLNEVPRQARCARSAAVRRAEGQPPDRFGDDSRTERKFSVLIRRNTQWLLSQSRNSRRHRAA